MWTVCRPDVQTVRCPNAVSRDYAASLFMPQRPTAGTPPNQRNRHFTKLTAIIFLKLTSTLRFWTLMTL